MQGVLTHPANFVGGRPGIASLGHTLSGRPERGLKTCISVDAGRVDSPRQLRWGQARRCFARRPLYGRPERGLKTCIGGNALAWMQGGFTHPAIASLGHPLSGRPERGLKTCISVDAGRVDSPRQLRWGQARRCFARRPLYGRPERGLKTCIGGN
jgi:hypothetical protein